MGILRWLFQLLLTFWFSLHAAHSLYATPNTPKTLRIAFPVAETGFDPPQVGDLYSLSVTAHIFEGLYEYDHWARPAKIRPCVADGMPEISADFKTWTIRIKPGIYFADDIAFQKSPHLDTQGRRELTAADFVYSFKRFADPATKSHAWGGIEETGFLGLSELRSQSLKSGKPFDYDQAIDGIRALDRYTLQLRTAKPRPALIEALASGDSFGAVAREVVEHYGDQIMVHPVGTGPYRLAQWRRSSRIVLEKNPRYREVVWDFAVAADDTQGQAVAKRLYGRRLPLIDRVEINIIEEQQPRWLAFLNQQIDTLGVPSDFVQQAMPQGKLAPNLARQNIQGYQSLLPVVSYTYFNMEDPLVGGYTPEKVALRRAIALGMDVEREIRLVRRGQAIPAQSAIVPHTSGYDPLFRSEMSRYDPARAKALLDIFGYIDHNGDGWRDQPDGGPLVLMIATQSDQNSRQFDELWRRNMKAIGLRVQFNVGKWPEQLKAARAGKLMMWTLGGSAGAPDGQGSLARFHSLQADGQNLARFKHPRMDEIYERMSEVAEGTERNALFSEAKRLAVAYMPYKFQVHTIATDLVQPWLIGWKRTLFWQDWWHRVDIDTLQRPTLKP
jgi:ABC-type transport system substrate-binding protein